MNTTGLILVYAISASIASGVTGCTIRVDTARETDAVRARSKEVSTAESAKDIQRVMTFWADDAVVQPAGMPQMRGHEMIEALYHQLFGDSTFKELSSTISTITVSESGDLAYEYGTNRVVYASSKGDLLDMGKYLLVWKKVNNDWYIAALSFSSNARAPIALATGG